MQTITQTASIGQPLRFDEGGYKRAISTANDFLIPSIVKVKQEYQLLGLQVPFNQQLFEELMTSGITETKRRLQAMAQEDAKCFTSPIAKKDAFSKVDSYLELLESAIEDFKAEIKNINRLGMYQFTYNDFGVVKGEPIVVTDRIKKQCTQTIENANQLAAYNKLKELEKVYNETVETFTTAGYRLPAFGLIGHNCFLQRVLKPGAFLPTDEIKLVPEALKLIK